MECTVNRQLAAQALRRRQTERMLATHGRRMAPMLAAGTPRDTGETAMSTHVETGHRSASGDRVAVRIVQRNVSVPLNFRLRRDYMIRALGGA